MAAAWRGRITRAYIFVSARQGCKKQANAAVDFLVAGVRPSAQAPPPTTTNAHLTPVAHTPTTQVQGNPYVKQAIQLEQWLMEGAYNKVLAAAQQLPSEFHSFYMQQLSTTVRCAGRQPPLAG